MKFDDGLDINDSFFDKGVLGALYDLILWRKIGLYSFLNDPKQVKNKLKIVVQSWEEYIIYFTQIKIYIANDTC